MSEPTIPQTLREVHRLRKSLRDLQGEIDRGPRVLKAHQAKVTKNQDALKTLQDQIKATKVQLNDREISIKSTNQLLAKYEKQLNELSVPKQIEATKHEIAHSEGERRRLEDESLELMMKIEELTSKVPDAEKLLAGAKKELQVFEAEAEERLARLKSEIARAEKDLIAVESQLPAVIKPQFDRIIKSYGPDGFAGVEGVSCLQCHSSITLQMQTELTAGKFVTCKNCGRGLYPVK